MKGVENLLKEEIIIENIEINEITEEAYLKIMNQIKRAFYFCHVKTCVRLDIQDYIPSNTTTLEKLVIRNKVEKEISQKLKEDNYVFETRTWNDDNDNFQFEIYLFEKTEEQEELFKEYSKKIWKIKDKYESPNGTATRYTIPLILYLFSFFVLPNYLFCICSIFIILYLITEPFRSYHKRKQIPVLQKERFEKFIKTEVVFCTEENFDKEKYEMFFSIW